MVKIFSHDNLIFVDIDKSNDDTSDNDDDDGGGPLSWLKWIALRSKQKLKNTTTKTTMKPEKQDPFNNIPGPAFLRTTLSKSTKPPTTTTTTTSTTTSTVAPTTTSNSFDLWSWWSPSDNQNNKYEEVTLVEDIQVYKISLF